MTNTQKLGIGILVASGIGLIYYLMAKVAFDPWVYDTDGDCYISMSEAQVAGHDCFMGVITEAQRDKVVYLWENSVRNPVCG